MRLRVAAILMGILAVAAAPTFAQVTGAVKVGVNFSKVSFEEDGDTFDTDTKSGVIVGVGVEMPIAPMFSFAPEFLYTMKGGKGGDLGGDDIKLKVDMFQIPLLFKAGGTDGPVRPFVVFGPAVGFVTAAKIESEEFDFEDDIKDEVETVEFSGIFGGGVQFGRGTVEYRYDHGFNNLDKSDTDSTAKSRTHSILFGIKFGGN